MALKYKRVLLKLSGEALAGEKKFGLDYDVVHNICAGVKKCVDEGAEIAIVVGGGNFWRGRSSGKMDRTRADHMGMLATVINSLALADGFESVGVTVRVQTAIAMQQIAEPYPQPGGFPSGARKADCAGLRHRKPLLLHRHRRRPAGRGAGRRGHLQGDAGGRCVRQ